MRNGPEKLAKSDSPKGKQKNTSFSKNECTLGEKLISSETTILSPKNKYFDNWALPQKPVEIKDCNSEQKYLAQI